VLREVDFDYFKLNYSFSTPLHTSDMYWAEDRLGKKLKKMPMRINKKAGTIALGTDFPVEEVNRCLLYAAVARKDTKEYQRWFFKWKMRFKSREE
jgi:predicted amidohydrolase YtcJ